MSGDVASTELLLRYGCDINAKNGDGETAIQMLSKVRVVQSNLGQIHCLQVSVVLSYFYSFTLQLLYLHTVTK